MIGQRVSSKQNVLIYKNKGKGNIMATIDERVDDLSNKKDRKEANGHFISTDIKSDLAVGDNIFEIKTSDADLNATINADVITALSQTQMAFAILNISGYLKIT